MEKWPKIELVAEFMLRKAFRMTHLCVEVCVGVCVEVCGVCVCVCVQVPSIFYRLHLLSMEGIQQLLNKRDNFNEYKTCNLNSGWWLVDVK